YPHLLAITFALFLALFFALRNGDEKKAELAPEAEPPALAPEQRDEAAPPVRAKEEKRAREPEPKIADEEAPAQAQARAAAESREPMPSVFVKPADTLLNSRSREARRSVAK